MKLEFDPTDVGEVAAVQTMVSALHQTVPVKVQTPTAPATDVETTKPDPSSVVETPTPASDDTGVSLTPSLGDQKMLDVHGMAHNPDIHSQPPKINADGSWKGRRGKKAELTAAIEAHKASQAHAAGQSMTATPTASPAPDETPAPPDPLAPAAKPTETPAPETQTGGMPQPTAPATPTPNEPKAPIDYETLGARFMAMIENNTILHYEQVYRALGVDYNTLPTDQRAIDCLWQYMDYRDQGYDDVTAQQAAVQAYPPLAA